MNKKLWTSKQADNYLDLSLITTMASVIFFVIYLAIFNLFTTLLAGLTIITTLLLWLELNKYYQIEQSVNRDLYILGTKMSNNQDVVLGLKGNNHIDTLRYNGKTYFADTKVDGYSLTTISYGKNIYMYKIWTSDGDESKAIYIVNVVEDGISQTTVFISQIAEE